MDDGEELTLNIPEWAEYLGVPEHTIYCRWYRVQRKERDYTTREITGIDKLVSLRPRKKNSDPWTPNPDMVAMSRRRLA
jgi:hypothetical protein